MKSRIGFSHLWEFINGLEIHILLENTGKMNLHNMGPLKACYKLSIYVSSFPLGHLLNCNRMSSKVSRLYYFFSGGVIGVLVSGRF